MPTQKAVLAGAATAPDAGTMLLSLMTTRRIRQAGMARRLGVPYKRVAALKQAKSMHTSELWALCRVLEHNFFAEIAAQLPATYAARLPSAKAPLEEELATVRQELLVVKAERDVLKEMISRRMEDK